MSYKKILLSSLLFSGLLFAVPAVKAEAADPEQPGTAVTAPETQGTPVTIQNPNFADAELGIDTQVLKGEVVTTDDGKTAVKLGSLKPTDGSDLSTQLWQQSYGKGMVNKVIHVQPNTTYTVSFDMKTTEGTTGQYGTMVLEKGDVKGELGSSVKDFTGDGSWKTYTTTLTTGPRSSELYAFAYIKDPTPGEAYITNYKATASPSAQPVDAVSTVDQQVTADGQFPVTIPAIQSFDKTEGTGYDLNREKEVIYADDASQEKAEYFASELKEAGLVKEAEVKSYDPDSAPSQGIILTVGQTGLASADAEKPVYDSYTININNGKMEVTGDDAGGVQYGTMTLLQAFKQRFDLPNGLVKDYTDQKTRGLQVDTGRHYWSIDWLKNEIEHMGYTKQNTLELRMKDSQGLRYDSKIAPELVDRTGFYSESDIKDLIAYAKKFNVTIIPEIDFPGHSAMDATGHPDFMFDGSDGLDISKPEVRDYMYSIYKEVADLFECKIMHIGGDEYFESGGVDAGVLSKWAQEESGDKTATEYDAFKLCMNEMADRLIKDGYQVTMWNDNIKTVEGAVPLDKRIIVDIWAGTIYSSASAQDYVDAGFNILSSSSSLYHDTWPKNDQLDRPLPEKFLWNKWSRYSFSSGFASDVTIETSLSQGQFFPIWDAPHGFASEYIVTQSLFPRTAVFAQRTWGSADPYKDYAKFETQAYYLGSANNYVNQYAVMTYNIKDVEKMQAQAEKLASTDDAKAQLDKLNKEFAGIENPGNADYTNFVHKLMYFCENSTAFVDASQLVPVSGIKLGATGIQVVKAGKTLDLAPAVAPEDATDKTVKYTFSKDGIVTADEKGVLTAVKPGMVKVTATAGDKTAAVTVRVTQ